MVDGPKLIMLAPAPVHRIGPGRWRLDTKFVDGMRQHQALWDGPVSVILWEGGSIPFGDEFDEAALGFALTVIAADEPLTLAHLQGAAVVTVSADMECGLDLARLTRPLGIKLVYVVEYTLGARLRIIWLNRNLSPLRRLRSTVWNIGQERRRRVAFRNAVALQTNGFPADRAYRRFARNTMMYLDGRMRRGMLATPEEMADRASRLRAGKPLRIVHSGRLEALKGAQDLVPIARVLAASGTDFTFDIFGAGSYLPDLEAAIEDAGLGARVKVHAPLPFETGLVPYTRRNADVFLSCHRQSDPSCTYLETMGCGVPIVGYDNLMWKTLAKESGGGWVERMGDHAAMARRLAELAEGREALIAASERAISFARAHDFETEFGRRMDHLAEVARG